MKQTTVNFQNEAFDQWIKGMFSRLIKMIAPANGFTRTSDQGKSGIVNEFNVVQACSTATMYLVAMRAAMVIKSDYAKSRAQMTLSNLQKEYSALWWIQFAKRRDVSKQITYHRGMRDTAEDLHEYALGLFADKVENQVKNLVREGVERHHAPVLTPEQEHQARIHSLGLIQNRPPAEVIMGKIKDEVVAQQWGSWTNLAAIIRQWNKQPDLNDEIKFPIEHYDEKGAVTQINVYTTSIREINEKIGLHHGQLL